MFSRISAHDYISIDQLPLQVGISDHFFPLPAHINPLEFVAANTPWFEHIEELALQALDGQLSLEELIEQNQHQPLMLPMAYCKSGEQYQSGGLKVDFQFAEEAPSNGYAHLLDSLLTSQQRSYSVWSTCGSEKIQPCLFTTPGLPSVSQLPAMMDGYWSHWGWPKTYMINDQINNMSNDIVNIDNRGQL
ncbi:hypothetical protein N8878_06110 [Psychromonas sp.]|nr:hypothetical protein [Psychromonas sp.]